MGGRTSPTALKMARIFANRMAASDSGTIENEPSAAAGCAIQKTPIPISMTADTILAQMPMRICFGWLLMAKNDPFSIPFVNFAINSVAKVIKSFHYYQNSSKK
jgi:hypothetical protein